MVLTSYAQWAAAVHPDDLPTIEATLQRAIAERQGSARPVEFRIIVNGLVRTVSAVEGVVLGQDAKVRRLVVVNMDITERKESESAAQHASREQLRFKDEFLSHVSHELRSPLTAVKQFTTILLGGLAGALNQEQHDYQQIVLKNVCQLQAMIGDILEVTRLETGKLTVEPEGMSLSAALIDAIHSFEVSARTKEVELSYRVTPDLPSVHADRTRLRQMLTILVENAIKFTPAGGAVSILAERFAEDPRFLRVDVSDTGCGISPENGERIFERLYQAPESTGVSRKGLGLGLYICKELVRRQGGRIWAEPRPPQGSTFSFTLPVCAVNSIIAPLLKDQHWPADSVALVIVEGRLAGAWPSTAAHDEWWEQAQGVIHRCLLPILEVILPPVRPDPGRDRLFVAAFTDEPGAASLVNRIRKHAQRIPTLKPAGLSLSVSYSMLAPIQTDAGSAVDEVVARMARRLEEAITATIVTAPVIH